MNEYSNKNRRNKLLEHLKRIPENSVLELKFRLSVVLLQSEVRQDGRPLVLENGVTVGCNMKC
jgi:hypothetical protein